MIKVAVLGFAHGHINGILEEWEKHPEYGVKAVCGWDSSKKRRTEGCQKHSLQEYDRVDDLLDFSDADAVIITSETAYHAQLAIRAAQAKKDIIMYKPIALTLEQADAIDEAVTENGVRFTMAWQMRCDPVNMQMKELITAGKLGKPYYFRRRHSLGVHNDPNFKNLWHCDAALNRDIFADDSAHAIDWMISLFGMPESVMCELSTMHCPEVKNDLGVAIFRYPSGMLAEITFCASVSAAEITTELYFERGALQHYGGDGVSTRLPHENQPSLKWFCEGDRDWSVSDIPIPDGQWNRICAQAKPLADFLNGAEPIADTSSGRAALKAVLACYDSFEQGKRISLK